jgi:PAS domain S-box-containing protein
MTENLTLAVRQSEPFYRQLVEAHPQAMWVYDVDSLAFLMVNEAAVARYGYSRQEFLNMTIADIRPADDMPALLETVENAPDGLRDSGVWRHRLRDDRIIFAEISSHTLEFEGRKARLVIAQDVTKRLVAEQQLRESEELFRAVASVTADVVWDWNVTSDAVWWSEGLKRVFGHSPEESLRNSEFWKQHIHPDDRERVIQSTHAAMERKEQTWRGQYRFLCGDGSIAYVEEAGYIIYDQSGTPVRFVGGMTDISERKLAEQKLAQQAALLDLARDAIIVRDIDNKVLFWNRGAEHMYGWTRADAVGRPLEQLSYDDPAPLRAITTTVLRSGEWSGEVSQHRKDGTRLVVEARCSLMRDKDGKPRAILSINTDISKRLSVEEQLRQAQRLEAVGQLTGGVAHDFNNLLTVILGNAEILSDRLAEDKNLHTLAEMTKTAAQRGADLTHRLLAFARRQALEPKVVKVNSLLRGMDGLLRRTLSEEIEIEFVQGGGLWNALVDPSQLETAVLNLYINARDAMPDGGRLTIETANTSLDQNYAEWNAEVRPGQYVMIAISDTGTGMPPEVISRAFEPFFTTKEVGKGSGLGLSMVFGFAKQSGGHVKIYSELNQGTTVKLYLPRALEDEERTSPEAKKFGPPRGSEKILLVEDDDLVRDHVVLQLRSLGYEVISTRDGPEALDTLKRIPDFDLLFTDVVMPGGLNGRQLAEKARELRPELPVLFTSGYTENAIAHHGRLDHGVHLLNKPYRREELAAKVRLGLEGNKAHRD